LEKSGFGQIPKPKKPKYIVYILNITECAYNAQINDVSGVEGARMARVDCWILNISDSFTHPRRVKTPS